MISKFQENMLLFIKLGPEPLDVCADPDVAEALKKLLELDLIAIKNSQFHITDDGEDYLRREGL